MRATSTQSKFGNHLDPDFEKLIDSKMIGHSPSFKSVSRRKLDIIKGFRPKYEQDFNNGIYRYNVKHIENKVTGKVVFDNGEAVPRQAHPNKLCRRGLTRLAEIALDVRKSSKGPLHPRNNNNLSVSRLRIDKSQRSAAMSKDKSFD